MLVMTQNQYAIHRGVTRQRISQLAKEGRLALTPSGMVMVEDSDLLLAQTLNPARKREPKPKPEAKAPPPPRQPQTDLTINRGRVTETEARTLNYLERAKRQKLDREKLEGKLLDKFEVEEAAFNAGRQTRDSVVGLVERKADEWHLIKNLFEFKLRIRRDLEEALRMAKENGDGDE